jgi:hypothetical protein
VSASNLSIKAGFLVVKWPSVNGWGVNGYARRSATTLPAKPAPMIMKSLISTRRRIHWTARPIRYPQQIQSSRQKHFSFPKTVRCQCSVDGIRRVIGNQSGVFQIIQIPSQFSGKPSRPHVTFRKCRDQAPACVLGSEALSAISIALAMWNMA